MLFTPAQDAVTCGYLTDEENCNFSTFRFSSFGYFSFSFSSFCYPCNTRQPAEFNDRPICLYYFVWFLWLISRFTTAVDFLIISLTNWICLIFIYSHYLLFWCLLSMTWLQSFNDKHVSTVKFVFRPCNTTLAMISFIFFFIIIIITSIGREGQWKSCNVAQLAVVYTQSLS